MRRLAGGSRPLGRVFMGTLSWLLPVPVCFLDSAMLTDLPRAFVTVSWAVPPFLPHHGGLDASEIVRQK